MGQCLKELNDPMLEGVLVDMEYFLARDGRNLPVSPYGGLGMDPNITNKDGRTALMGE